MATYIEQLQTIFQTILAQSTFLLPYLPAIQTAGIILALIICVAGYQVRKLCAAFIGLLIGAAAAAGAAFYFTNDITITIGAAILGGGIIAFIAYCIYRLGIFLLCAALTLFFLRNIWIGQPPAVTAMCAVIAVIIGFAAAFFKRIGITLITSIGGAFAAVKLYSMLKGHPTGTVFVICFAVLAVIGFIIQYQPWKNRKQRKEEEQQHTQKEKKQKQDSKRDLFKNKKAKSSRPKKAKTKTKTKTKTKVIYRDTNTSVSDNDTDPTLNDYDNTDSAEELDHNNMDFNGYEEAAYTTEEQRYDAPSSYTSPQNQQVYSDESDFNYAKKSVYTHPMDTKYHTKVNLTSNHTDASNKTTAYETKKPSKKSSEPFDDYDFFSVTNECINSKDN